MAEVAMEEVDHSSAGVDGGAHYTYVQLRLRQSRQPRTSQSAAEAYAALTKVYGVPHSFRAMSSDCSEAMNVLTPSKGTLGTTAVLVGLGQPILDISCEVDASVLARYGLRPGNCVLAEPCHEPLYMDLASRTNTQYFAGGSGQNTIRCAEWMLDGRRGLTAFIGAVGKDTCAATLRDACATAGVQAHFQVETSGLSTARCAVCVVGHERSMVTDLAASRNYNVSHLESSAIWPVVARAKVLYSESYFFTGGKAAIERVSRECARTGQTFVLGLSAPYIVQVPTLKAALMATLPYVDVLFGNEDEATAFAVSENWKEDNLSGIARKLSVLPKINAERNRIVVLTNGAANTVVAINGEVRTYPTVSVNESKLVDTNGAGDAYAGGFLAGLVLGYDVATCCAAGAYASSEVVQRSGCSFPTGPPRFDWREAVLEHSLSTICTKSPFNNTCPFATIPLSYINAVLVHGC